MGDLETADRARGGVERVDPSPLGPVDALVNLGGASGRVALVAWLWSRESVRGLTRRRGVTVLGLCVLLGVFGVLAFRNWGHSSGARRVAVSCLTTTRPQTALAALAKRYPTEAYCFQERSSAGTLYFLVAGGQLQLLPPSEVDTLSPQPYAVVDRSSIPQDAQFSAPTSADLSAGYGDSGAGLASPPSDPIGVAFGGGAAGEGGGGAGGGD